MKLQALLLSLVITTGAAMAQSNFTTCEVKPTDIHAVTPTPGWEFAQTHGELVLKENAEQQAKCIVELENRVNALEKKVSSLIKIVKMLQARVGKK